MNRYREAAPGDWLRTLAALIVFFVYVGLMTGVLVWTGHLWLYILSIGLGLVVLANWHTRTFAYRCAKCGHEFEIST